MGVVTPTPVSPRPFLPPSLCKPDMVYKINRTHGLHRLRGVWLMPLLGWNDLERPLLQRPQRMKTVMHRPRAFAERREAHRLLRQHLRHVQQLPPASEFRHCAAPAVPPSPPHTRSAAASPDTAGGTADTHYRASAAPAPHASAPNYIPPQTPPTAVVVPRNSLPGPQSPLSGSDASARARRSRSGCLAESVLAESLTAPTTPLTGSGPLKPLTQTAGRCPSESSPAAHSRETATQTTAAPPPSSASAPPDTATDTGSPDPSPSADNTVAPCPPQNPP